MIWRIEIKNKRGIGDPFGESVCKSLHELGISSVSEVRADRVYTLHGNITKADASRVARELLTDPVTETFALTVKPALSSKIKNIHIVEIAYHPGVMDPVEHSTLKGIKDLGILSVESVRTARRYILKGKLTPKQIQLISAKVLSNKLIQHVVDENNYAQVVSAGLEFKHVEIACVDVVGANDKTLKKLSADGQLFLSLDEMKAIRNHYAKLGRNPTDVELETVAQTWSEHCYHKTFRGNIEYTFEENGRKKTRRIKNLLKSTIAKATHELNKPWCVSVFHDNAGVIKFDKEDHVCFKVETHNHPSALEPFGGANTGIGGVIRDILGTGLGARPICSTDVFCFAQPDMDFKDLPDGTLHPKRVMKGVVGGVRDYGNKMGIPTVNGAVLFDKHFVGNPLVYCGNVGIMPKDKVFKKPLKGDYVVVAGGRTGRDGIHGATFSSGELTTESETVSSGAVQIGDPIEEKKVLDAMVKARDLNLYTAVTDCGAGGLSSAVGEMGEKLGARVDLDKVPLKYRGLRYDEIWISESQERMVFSVTPKNLKKLLAVFASENVEAVAIGTFTGTKRLELFYHGRQVCDLEMAFLHEGNPRITKKARFSAPKIKEPRITKTKDLNGALLDVMSHYNVCSKEWIIRQYDHEVQGGSIVKPLTGTTCSGPSDASVVMPKPGSFKGLAVSNGINPNYGKIDPYWMAAGCIDEAVRQIVAVGGDPKRIAILDNFCWGNPDKPDRLGGLVRCAEGCYKAAVGYGTPFISGKDSLYNEYQDQHNRSIAIPGTLLISAIGIVNDVRKTVTMDFKQDGNFIYCLGDTFDELGGSIYYDLCGHMGASVPKVNIAKANKTFAALSGAIQKRYVAAAHDCSDGGIGAALAEMCFASNKGATVLLDRVPYRGDAGRDDFVLFSESHSRFIVEVPQKYKESFEKICKGVPYGLIGRVESSPEVVVYGLNQKPCVVLNNQDLKKAWQSPLDW